MTRRLWNSSRAAWRRTDSIRRGCVLRRLDWRNLPDEQFPIILGSDVIYEARLVPLVANLLSKLLAPGGLGLIASPYRLSAEGFPAALASVGLTCRAEPATAHYEDGETVQGRCTASTGPRTA